MSYRHCSRGDRTVRIFLAALASGLAAIVFLASLGAHIRAFAQAGAGSAVDATVVDEAGAQQGQPTAKLLIGDAVDDADSPQYGDVAKAIDLFRQRRVKDARDLLTNLRVAHSTLPPAELLIAKLFILAGQPQLAMQELEMTVRKHPQDPEAFLILADGSLNERRITAAEALYQKAQYLARSFKENPKRKENFDKRVLNGLAAVNLSRQQWSTAETLLRELIKLDSKNAGAHQRLGQALFQQATPANKKREEAYQAFVAAAKIDPKAIKPDVAMGQLFEQVAQESQTAGDDRKFNEYRGQATAYFDRAIRSKDADLNTYLAAATWALQTSQFKLAQQYADLAMKADPGSLDAKHVAAVVARFSGNLPAAEKLLQEAWIDAPNNFGVSNQLALVLVESNNKEKQKRAHDLASQNAKLYPNNAEAASTLGWVLYQLDYKSEAGQVLDSVIRSGALTQDSAYYVAVMLSGQGRNAEALQILEDALEKPQPFANRENAQELLNEVKKQLATQGSDGKESSKTRPTSTTTRGSTAPARSTGRGQK